MNSDIGHTLKRNAINIGVNSIVAVLIALISAFFILAFFWDRHLEITHTTIELVCIYIELTAFSIIWNTYDRNTTVNHIIGFGFLIVGIFDVIHVYFHLFLPPGSMAVAQLAPYYSTAGRVAEAILLLAVSFDVLKVRINRWLWIIISLAFTLAASLYIYYSLDIWSYLNINNALPSVKIVIEYSMLAAYVVCALKLKGQILNREIITYKYIFISVLICIPAGMVAILGNVSFGISGVLEHVLKLCSSYYLYRGLFVSAITYSYEKLEENSEHIESVLNALPIGIITYGADQKVNFANTRFEELMGCSRKFVCGFSPTEIIRCFPEVGSPDGSYSISDVLAGKLNGGSCIGTFLNFNGSESMLSINAQRLKNGMLVMMRDVKTEQELQSIQLQTQTILNAINQAVLIADRDLRVVMYNKAFEDIFEIYERDGVRGKRIKDVISLIPDFGYKEIVKDMWEKSCISFDTYIVARSKKRKELLAHISQINNVEGELLGWVGVATDVTERKKEEMNIQQQEKLALIGQMAAGIVHEIKNPLSTIKGFNQIIKAKLQDEKLVKYAQTVDNAINDVSKVANDFLSFAKPHPSVVRNISLNELVSSMQLMISSHAYTKGIKTNFTFSEKEQMVAADGGQIKQVILNFCENAIDALSGVSDPALAVSTEFDERERRMLIKISDNGSGIEPENLSKVGTPFFTTKEKGTGLGVSICYQIISNHNGAVQVESAPGAGTTFTIILPCMREGE